MKVPPRQRLSFFSDIPLFDEKEAAADPSKGLRNLVNQKYILGDTIGRGTYGTV